MFLATRTKKVKTYGKKHSERILSIKSWDSNVDSTPRTGVNAQVEAELSTLVQHRRRRRFALGLPKRPSVRIKPTKLKQLKLSQPLTDSEDEVTHNKKRRTTTTALRDVSNVDKRGRSVEKTDALGNILDDLTTANEFISSSVDIDIPDHLPHSFATPSPRKMAEKAPKSSSPAFTIDIHSRKLSVDLDDDLCSDNEVPITSTPCKPSRIYQIDMLRIGNTSDEQKEETAKLPSALPHDDFVKRVLSSVSPDSRSTHQQMTLGDDTDMDGFGHGMRQLSLIEADKEMTTTHINDLSISPILSPITSLRADSLSPYNHSIVTPSKCRQSLGHISIDIDDHSVLTHKSLVDLLQVCGQDNVLKFEDIFGQGRYHGFRKIAEATFSEVFSRPLTADNGASNQDYLSSNREIVKIIPFGVEEDFRLGDDTLCTLGHVLHDIEIAKRMSDCTGWGAFAQLQRAAICQGPYPERLVEEWHTYAKEQLYCVQILQDGGVDLEKIAMDSWGQVWSVLWQVILALCSAEMVCQFEHRDLHWGNVLVKRTATTGFAVDLHEMGQFDLPMEGLKACIIDYSLSRMNKGVNQIICTPFDEDFLKGSGDYQFDIYRTMWAHLKDDWSRYWPRSNVYWIHYILNKLIYHKGVKMPTPLGPHSSRRKTSVRVNVTRQKPTGVTRKDRRFFRDLKSLEEALASDLEKLDSEAHFDSAQAIVRWAVDQEWLHRTTGDRM